MRRVLWVAVLLALASGAAPAGADERILDYQSAIEVHADGGLTVRETIRVRAEGSQIRRGIYRDFPTWYSVPGRRRVEVPFEVVETLRDGQPEPRRQERLANGVRTYLGRADVFLRPGIYTYTIVYRTARQLGLFADHDELYWNVTGNGWVFPIDRASATVTLPGSATSDALRLEAYTGPTGARGRDYSAEVDPAGRASFVTTRPLGPHEGLTIVVSFPKGLVRVPPPTPTERVLGFLEERWTPVVGGTGLALVVLYYLWAWWRVGRDPARGVVIPRFEPPGGLSPAAVRYVRQMGFDDRTFATALISLAVQGALTLEHEERGKAKGYRVSRRDGAGSTRLPPEEARLRDALFAKRPMVDFRPSSYLVVGKARTALREQLVKAHDRVSFRRNAGWLVPGVILSLVTLAAVALGEAWLEGDAAPVVLVGFLTFWLGGMGFGLVRLVQQHRWIPTFILAVMVAAGLTLLIAFGPSGGAPILVGLVAATVLFHYLLRAPTGAGRKLLDEIEGLRMYLTIAEKDRLNLLHPPEETPATFERFLPYAFALDVDQAWAERFAEVLAAQAQPDGTTGYSPAWYRGTDLRGATPAAMGASLAALGVAAAAAATPPGSSSGSSSGGGGGGSSGGGGGGGGGGGW